MKAVISIGRLGKVVETRGADYARERFVGHRLADNMMLLDRHDGMPLARLERSRVDAAGTIIGTFDVFDGLEPQVKGLVGRSLSIEFARGESELQSDATLDGGAVLVHQGAVVTAIAVEDDPARDDASVLTVIGEAAEKRSKVVDAGPQYPKAIRDRLAGKVTYGPRVPIN